MSNAVPLGRFVWFDIMAADPAAAITFYTTVTGWGTAPFPMPDPSMPPYTMWTAGGAPVGGVMQLPKDAPAPPHWIGYLSTPDLAGTLALAQQKGGTVLVPATPIPTVGHFAVVRDPQGAVFALFTPENVAPGSDGPPKLGELSWCELVTTDFNAAFEFYGPVFGWTKGEAMDMGAQGMYQLLLRNGTMMGGMYNLTSDMPMPPSWCHYVRVADLDAALQRVTAHGGQVVVGPMEVPGGDRIGMCVDPQGAMFALHWVKGG